MGGTVKQLVLGLAGSGEKWRPRGQEEEEEEGEAASAAADADSGAEGQDGLRAVRASGQEGPRRHERCGARGGEVLRRARSRGKKAELWAQQNPCYNGGAFVAHYGAVGAAQAHERWAPSMYPRHADAVGAGAGAGAEQITHLFSDDNPNACSIM